MKKFLTLGLALFSLTTVAVSQAAVMLSNVRKVYIEKMDNNLDQYLASSISAKFHGSLTVVPGSRFCGCCPEGGKHDRARYAEGDCTARR